MNSLLTQGYDSLDKSHNEEWKPIPEYEGMYEASNFGRIRTAEGKTTSNARFPKRKWKQRVLKTKSEKGAGYRGDLRVTLWKDGKPKDFLVARLVARAWVPGYSNELTVNHIDGNFLNNHSTNLEWLTREDNIRAGFNAGLYRNSQKPVRLIDENYNYIDFDSMAEASRYLGKNRGYISGAMKTKKSNFVQDKYGEWFIVQKMEEKSYA